MNHIIVFKLKISHFYRGNWTQYILVSPLLLNAVLGDLYLHMPRGSNNRLNENSGPRRNNNRLYDSQNNNNGGYNVGDATKDPATNMAEQHKEMYFLINDNRNVQTNFNSKRNILVKIF